MMAGWLKHLPMTKTKIWEGCRGGRNWQSLPNLGYGGVDLLQPHAPLMGFVHIAAALSVIQWLIGIESTNQSIKFCWLTSTFV
jgi:hypothetical protein